jgi:hypothetical protein
MYRRSATSLFVVIMSVLQGAQGGTLRIGDPIVEDDQYVFQIFLVEDTDEVAALDFRFSYDPEIFDPAGVTAGNAALQASKQVLGRVRDPGEFGVLVMGLNSFGIQEGEVARIAFERTDTDDAAATQLAVTNITFSDGEGVEVPSEENTRSLSLTGEEENLVNTTRQRQERTAKPETATSQTPNAAPTEETPGDQETSTQVIFGDFDVAAGETPAEKRTLPNAVREALIAHAAETKRLRANIPTPIGRLGQEQLPATQTEARPAEQNVLKRNEEAEQGLENIPAHNEKRADPKFETESKRAMDAPRTTTARAEVETPQSESTSNTTVLLGVAAAATILAALFVVSTKLFR